MGVTATTEAELEARTAAAFARTTALLRRTSPDLRLADGVWTVRDVAGHLLTVVRRYTRRDPLDRSSLADSPAAVRLANESDLRTVAELTVAQLVDQLTVEFEAYRALDFPLTQRFPFHAGQSVDGAGARSNWLGELLIHGYDVARAARRPWPIGERDALLILNGIMQVAPGFLDRHAAVGVRLDVAIRPRGATPQLLRIANGECVARDLDAADRPHAVIRGPAPALCLLLYRRISLLRAARAGVLLAGGTRPWTGLRVQRLFVTG
jgi:hypothetical protein